MHTLSPVDMFTPAQTCCRLGVSESGLLDLVNTGRLAAYDLGGNIRFKMTDVLAAQRGLVAA